MAHGSHGDYDKQDPNLPLVAFFAIGITVCTAIAAVWVRGWFDVVTVEETSAKLGQYPNVEWDSLRATSAQKLSAPLGWSSKEAQTAHIPLARAMELVVKEAKTPPAPEPAKAPDKPDNKKAPDNKAPEKKK